MNRLCTEGQYWRSVRRTALVGRDFSGRTLSGRKVRPILSRLQDARSALDLIRLPTLTAKPPPLKGGWQWRQ